MATRTRSAASATPSSARRTSASSAGKGNYVDDIKLPGMLHLELLRSPFAHARINSVDTSRAAALPGRRRRRDRRAAWRSTTSRGCRRSRATRRPCSPPTRCASRVRRWRPSSPRAPYIAKDALELIDVDYEPLPAVTSPQQALAEGAPLIRDEKEGQDRQPDLPLGGGRQGGDRPRLRRGRPRRRARHLLPALPPRAARVLRLRRRRQPGDGQGDDLHDVAGAARAPDALRARRRAPRAEDPDHLAGHRRRVRQQGADLPGYVVATAASLLIGRPVKWVEDRTGNLISTGFARDYHMHGELALKDGKITGPAGGPALGQRRLLRGRSADEVQGRALPHRHRLL